jgi:hypothetical protein
VPLAQYHATAATVKQIAEFTPPATLSVFWVKAVKPINRKTYMAMSTVVNCST